MVPDGVIVMRGVTRRFGTVTAVRDVSLSVQRGTILGLIGPSGSGKTTVIRMLTGTLEPHDGEIRVLDEEPMRFGRGARERISYMPQLFSLYHDLTARENVGFVAALYGIPFWRRGRLIRRALDVVDLWDARDRVARDLSGGMQRRLELACALVHEPDVLFIDEPTAGIDPMLREAIWRELRRLRDEGRTLLVTTQYVGEAGHCDRVALLAEGELVATDEPDQMRRSVFGGDVLDVVTRRAVDPDVLADVAGVLNVRQPEARRLIVVADEAATATPQIFDELNRKGIGVASIEEYQPSFDEVFTEMVGRRRAERGNGQAPATDERAEEAVHAR